jgi:hypothetical protein
MRLQFPRIALPVAAAIAFGALSALSPSAHAAQTHAKSSLSVMASWKTLGIYPQEECRLRRAAYEWAGTPAKCEWHVPISPGYEKLSIWQ